MSRKQPPQQRDKPRSRPEHQGIPLDHSATLFDRLPIGLLRELITPDVMDAVRARLDLTPEKLTLMIVRLINPDEILEKGEEAKLRGVNPKTLRAMRQNKEI